MERIGLLWHSGWISPAERDSSSAISLTRFIKFSDYEGSVMGLILPLKEYYRKKVSFFSEKENSCHHCNSRNKNFNTSRSGNRGKSRLDLECLPR